MQNDNRQTRITEVLRVPTFTNAFMQNQPFWSSVRNFNNKKTEYVSNKNDRNKYINEIKSKL